MRCARQDALCSSSLPISDATKTGEIQPCNISDPLRAQEGGRKPILPPPGSWLELLKHVIRSRSLSCCSGTNVRRRRRGCAGLLWVSWPRRLGMHRLQGRGQAPQPCSPIPACLGLWKFLPKAYFSLKHISLYFKCSISPPVNTAMFHCLHC